MNIYQNPKLFLDSFKLFVALGEDKLGRSLSKSEHYALYKKYAAYCSDFCKTEKYAHLKDTSVLGKDIKHPFVMLDTLYPYSLLDNDSQQNNQEFDELCEQIQTITPLPSLSYTKEKSSPTEKQVVDEIYQLTLAKTELSSGKHLPSTNAFALRKEIYHHYGFKVPFSFKASQLSNIVARYFSRLDGEDISKKRPIHTHQDQYEDFPDRIPTNALHVSYQKHLHYRAPLNTLSKFKRLTAAILAASSVIATGAKIYSSINHQDDNFQEIYSHSSNNDILSQTKTNTTSTENLNKALEEKLKTKEDFLSHFKTFYLQEYKKVHPNADLTVQNLKIKFRESTSVYKITTKNNQTFLMSYGSSPYSVQEFLDDETQKGNLRYATVSSSELYRIQKEESGYDDHGNPSDIRPIDGVGKIDNQVYPYISGDFCTDFLDDKYLNSILLNPQIFENLEICKEVNTELPDVTNYQLEEYLKNYRSKYIKNLTEYNKSNNQRTTQTPVQETDSKDDDLEM